MESWMRFGGMPLAGLVLLFAAGACGGGDVVVPDQPDGGAPDPSAIGTLGAACDKAGALACAGHAQKLQLLCDGTKWVSNGVCPDDKICDTRPGPNAGSCQSPDPKCVGKKAGEAFCDGATRRVCDADLLSSTSTPCPSPELCAAGVGDKCAKCLKGQKVCEGAVLKGCADDGQSFVVKETCATAAQCVETADTCYPPTCAIGEYRCSGDKLQTCKDTRNDWSDVKLCPSGLCDAATKDCRECIPDAKDCAGDTPRLCDKTGHWTSLTPCSGVTPLCKVGICSPGVCLASEYRCNIDTLEACNSGKTGFDPVKVCSPGLCDSALKQCDDCKSGDKACLGSTPRACDSTGHWKDLTPCSGTTPVCTGGVCAAGLCIFDQHRCTGDSLEKCNATFSGYDPVKTCPAGLCDATLKQCDECKAGSIGCKGTTVPQTCDATFHWKDSAACVTPTPYCSAGKCDVCSGGLTSCSSACVDLTSDKSNCGSCGKVCGAGLACAGSACVTPVYTFSATGTGASGTIQTFTVSTTGTFTIEVWGAQGGAGANSCAPACTGGKGARMRGDFDLTAGTVLKIIVGQLGLSTVSDGGGGGGSFVVKSDGTALIIAGGGGGVRSAGTMNGYDAVTGTTGVTSSVGAAGGTGGLGGSISSGWGAGGGGLTGDGTDDGGFGEGGKAYTSGGFGGKSKGGCSSSSGTSADGGFGGGGAGNGCFGGGGGGGYSGGGGGWYGGGGGSFNIGANPSNTAGARSGAGLIVITQIK